MTEQKEYFLITDNEMRLLMTIGKSQELRDARRKAWYDAHARPYTSAEKMLEDIGQRYSLVEAKEIIEHIYSGHSTCKSERINCPLCIAELSLQLRSHQQECKRK